MKNVYERSNNGAKAYYSSAAKAAKEIHGILSRASTHHERPAIFLLDSRGRTDVLLHSIVNLTKKDISDRLGGSSVFHARIGTREVKCVELEVN